MINLEVPYSGTFLALVGVLIKIRVLIGLSPSIFSLAAIPDSVRWLQDTASVEHSALSPHDQHHLLGPELKFLY